MMVRLFIKIGLFLFLIPIVSCEKYLDKKPDNSLAIPSTLKDLQSLLDNYIDINSSSYPNASEALSDNYYWNTSTWQSQGLESRNLYTWSKDDQTIYYWLRPYQQILISNIVLETVDGLKDNSNDIQEDHIKGSALFIRAYYFYAISQLFAGPYNSTSLSGPGIVLRLTSDFNDKSTRSTLSESYEQILKDLKDAAELLPVKPFVKSRPSKPAAYGALARAYLSMNDFDSAGYYANKCLQLYDSLIDYNDLNILDLAPIKRFNKEVIFQMRSQSSFPLSYPNAIVDSSLYNSYVDGDLRSRLFFDTQDGKLFFKGDYDGEGIFNSGYVFSGIVTDEQYLILSECLARLGKVSDAMYFLNKLLKTRWENSTPYEEIIATDRLDALKKIIAERRKELLFRGLRWTDLRRLKDDPDLSTTPQRVIDGQVYKLDPNSPRYTLLIPVEVINQSGIEQNP